MSEYGNFKNIERQRALEYEEEHWEPKNRRELRDPLDTASWVVGILAGILAVSVILAQLAIKFHFIKGGSI